jgi:hypothetical protein
MGNAERRRFGDVRMLHERCVHCGGRHLESAATDQLLDAADDVEIAILVEITEVAGAKPPCMERCSVGLRVILVAREHFPAAHDEFANFALRQECPRCAQHPDLAAGRKAHRAGPAPRGWYRIMSDATAFRHRISLQDRDAERSLESFLLCFRQGGRCRQDVA